MAHVVQRPVHVEKDRGDVRREVRAEEAARVDLPAVPGRMEFHDFL